MANLKARVSEKEAAVIKKRLLLWAKETNPVCADCPRANPTWASVNLGVLVCLECAGKHRSLGTHISKMRSLSLDTILPEEAVFLLHMSNDLANKWWEARLDPSTSRSDPSFVRMKYTDHTWALRDPSVPAPSRDNVPEGHPWWQNAGPERRPSTPLNTLADGRSTSSSTLVSGSIKNAAMSLACGSGRTQQPPRPAAAPSTAKVAVPSAGLAQPTAGCCIPQAAPDLIDLAFGEPEVTPSVPPSSPPIAAVDPFGLPLGEPSRSPAAKASEPLDFPAQQHVLAGNTFLDPFNLDALTTPAPQSSANCAPLGKPTAPAAAAPAAMPGSVDCWHGNLAVASAPDGTQGRASVATAMPLPFSARGTAAMGMQPRAEALGLSSSSNGGGAPNGLGSWTPAQQAKAKADRNAHILSLYSKPSAPASAASLPDLWTGGSSSQHSRSLSNPVVYPAPGGSANKPLTDSGS